MIPHTNNELKRLTLPKILLIEDDRTTIRMVEASLEAYCRIFTASTVSQGIKIFWKEQPDLVFLDISLPQGDGHKFLDAIMKRDPGAYIVMFSGHTDADNIIKSMNNGAVGFVSKPFTTERMLHYVHACPNIH